MSLFRQMLLCIMLCPLSYVSWLCSHIMKNWGNSTLCHSKGLAAVQYSDSDMQLLVQFAWFNCLCFDMSPKLNLLLMGEKREMCQSGRPSLCDTHGQPCLCLPFRFSYLGTMNEIWQWHWILWYTQTDLWHHDLSYQLKMENMICNFVIYPGSVNPSTKSQLLFN
jgi:hypothetical protein